MSGLSIGVGVGLKYLNNPNNKIIVDTSPPSEENITDAILTESNSAVMSEDSRYIRTENDNYDVKYVNEVKNKSYWNFQL